MEEELSDIFRILTNDLDGAEAHVILFIIKQNILKIEV